MTGAARQATFAELIGRGALAIGDGYRAKLDELGGSGPIFLRAARLTASGFDWSEPERFRDELDAQVASKLGRPRDTVITTKGNGVGRCGYVPDGAPAFVYSPHLSYWRSLDDKTLAPGFLRYWASGPEFGRQLAALAHGTDMAPYLSLADQRRLVVTLPEPESQRGIAATLGALDDKIESNRRAVALTEKLLLLEFQALLEVEQVIYRTLREVAVVTKGVSYKSTDLRPSRTSLVTLKSFDRNGGYKADGLKPYIGPYKPEQRIEPGEVVVAQTDLTQGAEVVGRAVRVPAEPSADVLVASLDLAIIRPGPELCPEYLLGVLTNEAFRQHCRSRTSGTTVLHLGADAIPTYKAPIVASSAQRRYAELVRPLISRMDSLKLEADRLAALRDALLPELLSGRIRVPEAAETAAATV